MKMLNSKKALLIGFGSILNIYPVLAVSEIKINNVVLTSPADDLANIASDWQMVGSELYKTMEVYGKECK